MTVDRARKQLALAAVLFAAGVLVLNPVPSFAQAYEQVAPKQPKPEKPGTVTAPAEKPAAPEPAKNPQLLPALKGLRFIGSIKALVREGVSEPGISVGPGLPLLDDTQIQSKLSAFLDKPLHAHDLSRISQTILDWYRAHDLPVVDVTFPEQDINSGTVQAVVTVYRLGKVEVSGNQWFSSDVLKDEMQVRPGDQLDFAALKDDLNRLNRNPFRRVNAVLERGQTPGDTNVALHVQDRLPLRVFASFDNDGLPSTGRDRYSAGFNWGNVFGLDQQFSYQFITSPDLWRTRNRGAGHSNDPRFTAHSASYLAPLPWWGDTLSVFGTYVEQVPDLGPNFDQVGHSVQLSLRYARHLPAIGALSQQIQFGFDYKRTDNDLDFGGTNIFASSTNVEQFLAIYGATLPDAWGQTAIENQLIFSPGGLSDGNTTAVFLASGVNGARANYIYDNLQITRVTLLPWHMTSVVRFNGQLASAELLPSEQLGAGGPSSVRGYNTRVVNGSQGVLVSGELRSPSYNPLQRLGVPVKDSGQLLVFYDAGFVSNLHTQQSQPRHATLQSAGVGARYSIDRYLDVRCDYGWQLTKAPGATSTGSLASVSVSLSY